MQRLITLVLLFFSLNLFAQEKLCADKFDLVSLNCLKSFEKKLSSKQLKLKEILENDVFVYNTSSEFYGKLKVKAAYQDKKKCLLYFEYVSYQNGKKKQGEKVLEIVKRYGSWGKETIKLDRKIGTGAEPVSDMTLTYSPKAQGCVIDPDNALYHKIFREKDGLIEESVMLYWAAIILIGIGVYIVANTVFAEEDKYKASELLEDAEEDGDKKEKNLGLVVQYSKPFFKRYFSPIVKNMKNKRKIRDKYKRKLANAGLTKDISPEDFFAFKLFLIIGFPIVFLALRQFLEETWPLAAIPGLSVFGFIYPDMWLNGVIDKRKEEILLGMPFIVDMLALSVEAGLDFVAAMTKVIEKAPPSPLAEEFETMIKEIKIGSSRAEGLRQLAWRVDVLPVSSFTATLIAADSVGASIGPILKQLSGELRTKRSSEAEKKGATAATKILIPMMMFVLPAVLIVIAGPIVMQLMAGN